MHNCDQLYLAKRIWRWWVNRVTEVKEVDEVKAGSQGLNECMASNCHYYYMRVYDMHWPPGISELYNGKHGSHANIRIILGGFIIYQLGPLDDIYSC